MHRHNQIGLDNLGPANFDEWTENATFVLLVVWGDRFMQLGRRSLRSEDWVEVAEKVSETCMMEINDGQCRTRFEMLKLKHKKEKAKMEGSGMRDEGYPGESEVDEDEEDEEDEDEDEEVDKEEFKLLAESIQNFCEIYEKIEGKKQQQIMELEKMRVDFQMELELQKVILERAQAEIARIREEDDEDANSVENLSG
ncbi:hypothetical protein Tco_1110937 [Tanacetum coccineum]|uniref:Myb/SANT-like DNA-binding domain-containing protein n=1 Tax=Tanacetum coccineum TaxID=301880 RepID=A0ABQ5IMS9_9ASTR